MEALEIKTVFILEFANISIPISETVLVSWLVMLILIIASVLLTRRLKEIPSGFQIFLEAGIDFLNNFAKDQFGAFSKFLGPYMGSLFLFLIVANMIGLFSPSEGISLFSLEFSAPFAIHPPTRDINVTAALASMSILLLLVCGLFARGITGWFKHLLHPIPMMLPFNILEYATRLLSLALRLFGNVLGSVVIMGLISGLVPVIIPMLPAIYFEIFDGVIQAVIFVFLTSLYISEAVKVHD
ncbi:MAG: F0F1 ATP synthase subunit A [Treponema sp.]|nr:F0F1 ATP synthase subunit A [Treponema sp.]